MKYSQILLSFTVAIIMIMGCREDKNVNSTKEGDSISEQESTATKAIANDPNNAQLYFERAKIYYDSEQYDKALDDSNRSLKLDSTVVDYFHLKADILLDYYRSKEAIDLLESMEVKFPGELRSLLKLAEFYLILRQNDNSFYILNKVIKQDPINAEAYYMLGLNFRALQDTVKAMNSLQRAVELDADFVEAWILLGNFHESLDSKNTLQYYDNALDVEPDNIEALHSKAFYLQNHDKISDAISIYKTIEHIDSTYLDAYLNAGILYLELDSVDQAREKFQRLIGLDTTSAMAYYYRGVSFELLNDQEKAKADYEKAKQIQPENPRFQIALESIK